MRTEPSDTTDDLKQFAQITVPTRMLAKYEGEGWVLISHDEHYALVRRAIRACSCRTGAY